MLGWGSDGVDDENIDWDRDDDADDSDADEDDDFLAVAWASSRLHIRPRNHSRRCSRSNRTPKTQYPILVP